MFASTKTARCDRFATRSLRGRQALGLHVIRSSPLAELLLERLAEAFRQAELLAVEPDQAPPDRLLDLFDLGGVHDHAALVLGDRLLELSFIDRLRRRARVRLETGSDRTADEPAEALADRRRPCPALLAADEVQPLGREEDVPVESLHAELQSQWVWS